MWISIGKSRKETKWKNTEISWEKFVDKFRSTKYTNESYEEYKTLKKSQQDEIKDVGGFIGGTVFGGRRKAGSITGRWILTLDADRVNGPGIQNFIDSYDMIIGCSGFLYTTHNHCHEKPRVRLVIQFDNEVQSDAYEAIGRRIAEWLDIEQFDPTTYQPERLMYFPSTSKEGEYIFHEFKGKELDTDMVLRSYNDWTDSSEWPVSKAMNDALKKHMTKQGDPLDKPGIIGVFCRVYGIAEVIEKYLNEIYEPTDQDDRYSYINGTTTAGVVVYENKFSYSHHGTDPASMKLCNAFDLVRIHLFGDLDNEVNDDTPGNKYPSYIKMVEFSNKDKQVKRIALAEKINNAKNDFRGDSGSSNGEKDNHKGNGKDGQGGSEDETDDSFEGNGSMGEGLEDDTWMDQLEIDRNGNCLNTINNSMIILENDPMIKDTIRFNDFDKRIYLNRNLPWRKIKKYEDSITDSDDASFRNYFEQIYKITSKEKIEDAIDIVSRKHAYHPIRDYIRSLKWDGEERLALLLIEFLGAENDEYTRNVTFKAFVGAVARIFEPGIKFDHVLTFSGVEGAGKSFLLNKMGMEWFSDSFGNLHTKESVEQVQGVWLMEVGELYGFKKAEAEAIKLFLSKREDRFRVAYGRRVEVYPRQCVFFGTTNEDMFLKSTNGNRRFWPIKIDPDFAMYSVFTDLTQDVVDQLWAEAYQGYLNKESLYLSKELEIQAHKIQEQFREQDDRKGIIVNYLEMEVPGNWYEMNIYDRRSFIQGEELTTVNGMFVRFKISIPEIWTECLGNTIKDMTFYNTKFIRDILNNMSGWKKKTIRTKDFGSQKGYIKMRVFK